MSFFTEFGYYYHYTDIGSLDKIIQSGEIRKSLSNRGDAAFGEGVYLTRLDPMNSKTKILYNNYCRENGQLKGKADAVLRLEIRTSAVEKCSNTRDVFLYPNTLRFASNDVKVVKAFHIQNTQDGKVVKEIHVPKE